MVNMILLIASTGLNQAVTCERAIDQFHDQYPYSQVGTRIDFLASKLVLRVKDAELDTATTEGLGVVINECRDAGLSMDVE